MRNIFAEKLYQYAKKNKKIHVVTADISPAGSMEKFRKKYPNRFINVGVAEQVMIGVTAGLAMRGMVPFAYTIAAFALYRPFEMIRDDLCYQNLPVTVVGMGSGTAYANLGGTHLTQEDVALAKTLPNMNILVPADPLELSEAVKYCCTKNKSPLYLRIGKSGEQNFTHKAKEKWKFGKIRKIKDGSKTCIITYGPIIKIADEVIKKFKLKNENISLYTCHTIKPLDTNRIKELFRKYKNIICIEDQTEIGGLGQSIKTLGFDNKYKGNILTFGLKDKFFHSYTNQDDLFKLHDIDIKKIIGKIDTIK